MKIDISKIDKNFLIGSVFESESLIWNDIQNEPIEIRGLAVSSAPTFCRLPLDLIDKCSDGVRQLSYHTAGGRVRFTLINAKRLAVRCESLNSGMMSHMPLTGSAGVDVYVNGIFRQAIRPANDNGGVFEGETYIKEKTANVEINLPLYNGITRMLVGIDEGAEIAKPKPYKYEKPTVYYGSSITQGGCASRPGNSYQGFISRWLNSDQINLGFSGQAKGEDVIAEYIASLDMSAFVFDYDHNAPNVEYLKKTHERFYKIIRNKNQKLPIIIVSRPDTDRDMYDTERRLEVIRETYQHAIDSGDEHVWLIDGRKLFGARDRDACTVDGTHPNDIGFYRMAKAIYPALKKALAAKEV